jgi:hypothetical protein
MHTRPRSSVHAVARASLCPPPFRLRALLVATLVAMLLPAGAGAQGAATAAVAPSAEPSAPAGAPSPAPVSELVPVHGPVLDAAAVGVRAIAPVSADEEANAVAMQRRRDLGQSQILMIVGGSAVVVGLITGDTAGQILVLGGAVVGLVGLYQYLKSR